MTAGSFDVVVIGSGFGGAVAANRLALAGKRVLVLERGPWRDSVPVRSMGIARRAPFPYGAKTITHFLHSIHGQRFGARFSKTGMFELGVFPGMYTVAASAVGGGSTAYGSLLERPNNSAMWRTCHPALDPAAVERYYDKVISDMGAARVSRDQPQPQTVWDHFPDSGNRCRPADEQPHVAMLMPPTMAHAGQTFTDSAGIERRYCAFDGDGFLGSRDGAKASVDLVYLAPVLGKGVTVRDLCEVRAIKRASEASDAGYVVEFEDLDREAPEAVAVPLVVMAAGTLNTLRLLFASSVPTDGLNRMPALGRGYFGNGDLIGAWVKKPSDSPSSFRSAPVLGGLSVLGHERKIVRLGSLAGFDTWPLPGFVERFLSRVFLVYAMAADSGKASVQFIDGRIRTDYDYRREPIYDELRNALHIVEQDTGTRVYSLKKPLTPHMGGGARVAPSPREGVVDHRGEVYGNPGLYVADATALPAPPGGPPALAIAAWAHYVADGIASRP